MHKLKWFKWIALPILVVLVSGAVWAGTTGKFSGVVRDEATGEPLQGVAVSIVGLQVGALTDAEGRFVILNVPVGTYTLRAAIVGYQSMGIENLKISVDLTTAEDFVLTQQAVEMGAVSVTVQRPLVQQDRTSSLRLVTEEEISHLPTRGYQEIVGLQAGAVRFSDNAGVRQRGGRESSTTGSVYVRGGRASEVAYYVDGFSQQDPLTGLSTTQINNNSIKEVSIVTGGFNAEYGLIMSGAVNVTTKEGGDVIHGTVETITDNFHGENYDYNVYSGVLNGPVLPGSNKLTFYAAGERRWTGDRDPHARAGGMLPSNQSGLWNWQGKLAWRPTADVTVRLGTIGSREQWQEYTHSYLFNAERMPRYDDKNNSFNAELTYTVSPKTFFTVSGSWFKTERLRGDGIAFDDIWAYGRPSGNPRNDAEDLFRAWDDMNIDEDGNRIVTPVTYDSLWVLLPDGDSTRQSFVVNQTRGDTVFADESHVWDDYLHRQSSYIGGDFDLVSQVHPNHEIKAGLEYQRHTLRRYQHYFPTQIYLNHAEAGGGFTDINSYGYNFLGLEPEDTGGLNDAKNPINFAAYLQDKFEWEGLVVNAGLRLDVFDYRTERLIDPDNPLDPTDIVTYVDTVSGVPASVLDSLRLEAQNLTAEDLEPSESVSRISPRLGVAFPVADGSVLHFSYGKFFQRPDLENLYVNYTFLEWKIKSGGYFVAFGNPNLEPEETTAYEVGWRRQVSDDAAIDITAFYKDIKNLTEVITQPARPTSFATYRNRDYGTVKGLEFTFDLRRNRGISANLNYTISWADGTGSFANTSRNTAWTNDPAAKGLSALDFDQRHKLTGIIDVRAGVGEGPKLGDWYPLERAGVNFLFSAGSGFPYTPVRMYNEATLGAVAPQPIAQINTVYAPWMYRLDLKANKEIPLGGMNLDVFVWVLNVLDRENVVDVYEVSGEPDRTGWLETPEGQAFVNTFSARDDASFLPGSTVPLTGAEKYELKQLDPRNYDTPRQIRIGARWTF